MKRQALKSIAGILLLFFAGCGHRPKVLLIGLDGATWKVINSLREEGKTPSLDRLIRIGASGTIITLEDRVSPTIWTSVATGKLPAKHKIEDFTVFDRESDELIPYRSYDRQAAALWNILSDRGKKAGVFNWLITWPPERINGFMISDYENLNLARSSDTATTYPAGLREKLPSVVMKIPPDARTPWEKDRYKARHTLSYAARVSSYLRKREAVDVLMLYTPVLDFVQHRYWKFMVPGDFNAASWELNETDLARYKDMIKELYAKVDDWIGDVLRDIGGDTTVIILSDHGFKSRESERAIDFSKMINRSGMAGKVKVHFLERGKKRNYVATMVPRGDMARFVSGIRTENGTPLFEITETADAPGMIIRNRDFSLSSQETVYIGSRKYKAGEFFNEFTESFNSGTHDYEDGILIVAGKHIKKGIKIVDASVLDIAPTVLYLMGLPVARDMDGKVLTGIMDDEYVARHPVTYIETYESGTARKLPPKTGSGYDKELLNQLRTLGYIQ